MNSVLFVFFGTKKLIINTNVRKFCFKVSFLGQNRLKTHFMCQNISKIFIVLGIYNFGWNQGDQTHIWGKFYSL